MPEKRVNKDSGFKPKGQNPRCSNDQLGENAGEGRMMKEAENSHKNIKRHQ
ncbi:MAG TPA: hypothetical protein VHO66_04825 [Ruminiclostridium sp.]|nr:hypothetical protein [Ruminiclostridium sp.]